MKTQQSYGIRGVVEDRHGWKLFADGVSHEIRIPAELGRHIQSKGYAQFRLTLNVFRADNRVAETLRLFVNNDEVAQILAQLDELAQIRQCARLYFSSELQIQQLHTAHRTRIEIRESNEAGRQADYDRECLLATAGTLAADMQHLLAQTGTVSMVQAIAKIKSLKIDAAELRLARLAELPAALANIEMSHEMVEKGDMEPHIAAHDHRHALLLAVRDLIAQQVELRKRHDEDRKTIEALRDELHAKDQELARLRDV